jgi:hypothetical protein
MLAEQSQDEPQHMVMPPVADKWSEKFLPVMYKGKTLLDHLIEICEWLLFVFDFVFTYHCSM